MENVERVEDDKLIWHYTTMGNLVNILQSRTLYATEVNFLNDIRETVAADELFSSALDVVGKSGAQYAKTFASLSRDLRNLDESRMVPNSVFEEHEISRFILCASKDPDSLYAWRTYASKGDVACAIGLDPEIPLVPLVSNSESKGNWQQVRYDAKNLLGETVSRLNSCLDDFAKEVNDDYPVPLPFGSMDILEDLRSRCKDPNFAQEREVRITHLKPELSLIKFIAHPMGPRPHLPLGVRAGGDPADGKTASWAELPIRGIKLGPEAPDTAIASAKWLLEANGYSTRPVELFTYDDEGRGYSNGWDHSEKVHVSKSALPYRSA